MKLYVVNRLQRS